MSYEIKNAPIFSVGTWNGDVYSEADLDHMVAAFNQVGFRPPLKLGHDESQPLAQSDGMPALGWVTNLRRMGKQLVADFSDLPRKVYEAIRRKNYDRVSAEVYWEYEANGKKWPRVLKALALLGAEIPAVTNLASLESLYDAQGHTFKRYGFGLMLEPVSASSPDPGADMDQPKKSKASVNYRQGGADDDGDGFPDRCGSCEFFLGPPDPNGVNTFIAACALVEGDIASTWLCDLYEPLDAFSSEEMSASQEPRRYMDFTEKPWDGSRARFSLDQLRRAVPDAVRAWAEEQAKMESRDLTKEDLKLPFREPDGTVNLNGVRAALSAIGGSRTGKAPNDVPKAVLDKSQKQLRSILAKGNGSMNSGAQDGGVRTISLSRESLLEICPSCVERMDFLNIRELKVSYDPATRTYTGFNQALCKKFGKQEGFRTRCMDSGVKDSVDDVGAFCNALKEFCFGTVKDNAQSDDARSKEYARMRVKEVDGKFCVMKDGEKMKCFETREEADAFQVSMMAQSAAEVKALQSRLEAAEQVNRDLVGKVSELEQTATKLTTKFSIAEEHAKAVEAERDTMREASRKASNDRWLEQMCNGSTLKILPWEKPYVAFILDHLTGGAVKTYADNGAELTPNDAFRRLYEQRKPGTILTQELSRGSVTKDAERGPGTFNSYLEARDEAVRRAKVYMQEKNVKEFSVAYAAVLEQDPELKNAAGGVTPMGARKAQDGATAMGRFFKK